MKLESGEYVIHQRMAKMYGDDIGTKYSEHQRNDYLRCMAEIYQMKRNAKIDTILSIIYVGCIVLFIYTLFLLW